MKTTRLFGNFFPGEVLAYCSDAAFDFTLPQGQRQPTESQHDFLSQALGLDFAWVAVVRQVHGARVSVLTKANRRDDCFFDDADGLLTDIVRLPLLIRTADCLPVFLYDVRKKCVGLLHAGWRSSKGEIARVAVERMKDVWDSDPRDIRAALGAGIRSCCYEVGREMADVFPEETETRDGRFYLDLPRVNINQLRGAGLKAENILDCAPCTCCNERYYSFRRQKQGCGRMASVVMLTG